MRSKSYIGHYKQMKKLYKECRFYYILEDNVPKFMYNKRRKWVYGRHRLLQRELLKKFDREMKF